MSDQHGDNADELGVTLGEWFNDKGGRPALGAQERPEWGRLIAKIESGRSGGFMAWDISRASRDHWFGASLVKLVRDHGLRQPA